MTPSEAKALLTPGWENILPRSHENKIHFIKSLMTAATLVERERCVGILGQAKEDEKGFAEIGTCQDTVKTLTACIQQIQASNEQTK